MEDNNCPSQYTVYTIAHFKLSRTPGTMTILPFLGFLFFTFENVWCGCVVKPPINQDSPQVAQIGNSFT